MKTRIHREQKTVTHMITLYCRHHHTPQPAPCPTCQALLAYSLSRLTHCNYQNHKPTCARCPIHCYKPEMRTQIQQVMRYSGPRMLLTHPLLALMHVLDQLKNPKL